MFSLLEGKTGWVPTEIVCDAHSFVQDAHFIKLAC